MLWETGLRELAGAAWQQNAADTYALVPEASGSELRTHALQPRGTGFHQRILFFIGRVELCSTRRWFWDTCT